MVRGLIIDAEKIIEIKYDAMGFFFFFNNSSVSVRKASK